MQDAQVIVPSTTGTRFTHWMCIAALTVAASAAQGDVANQPVAATTSGAQGGAAEVVVRLLPSALVEGDEVTLADVAELQGDAANLLASWPVGAAPARGSTGVLELAQVQSRLARRGVNLSSWVFRGSSRCVVQRASVTEGAPKRNVVGTQPAATDKPIVKPSAAPGPMAADPQSLEGSIHLHMAAKLSALGGTPVLRFSPAVARALRLKQPEYQFQIHDRGERLLGIVPLDVSIFENGKLQQTLPVLVNVALKKHVVVANRPLNRGQLVATDDVRLDERTFERVEDVAADRCEILLGQRMKRFVEQQGLVFARDVEPVPLVVRNDLVMVTARRGNIVLRSAAKAITSGCFGEVVQLRNESSRESFTAVVTGPKTAELSTEQVAAVVARGDE